MWINNIFPFYTVEGKPKKWAQFENDYEFQNTFMLLFNLALNQIHIDGLPDTCNENFFKANLILNGMAGLINDPELGFLTLKVMPSGQMVSMYGEWPKVFAYGWNGFNKEYTAYMYGADNTDAECVICRDNYFVYPLVNYIFLYAKRLTNLMRTIDVTTKKLKTPYFITCDETQKTSVQKVLSDIEENKDAIITSRSTAPNLFQVLQTNIQSTTVRDLWTIYNNMFNLIKSYLGIKNVQNMDKSERLIVDEANADAEEVQRILKTRVDSYQQFCDTVNKMWGLSLSVRVDAVKENSDDYMEGSDTEDGEGEQGVSNDRTVSD